MPQQTLVNVKKTTKQAVDLQSGGATIAVTVNDSIPFAGTEDVEVFTQANGRQTVDGMGAWGGSRNLHIATRNLAGPQAAVVSNVGVQGRAVASYTRVQGRAMQLAHAAQDKFGRGMAPGNPHGGGRGRRGGFNGLGDMVTNFLGLGEMAPQTKTVAIVGIAAAAAYFLFLRKK